MTCSMLLADSNNITIANLVFKIDNGLPVIEIRGSTGFLSQISVLGCIPIKLKVAIDICSSHFEISDEFECNK